MLEFLNELDHDLFLAIHNWRNGFLDAVMPVITTRWFWIPLYVLLLFLLWRRFGKQVIMIALTITVLMVASDQSANLLKNNLCRYRPSHDPALEGKVCTPTGKGGDFGFVSGHAANTFALATFLWLLSGVKTGVGPVRRRWPWALLFLWSLLVCWSRIYVGKHFPLDVIGGAILGGLWAALLFFIYRKFVPVLK